LKSLRGDVSPDSPFDRITLGKMKIGMKKMLAAGARKDDRAKRDCVRNWSLNLQRKWAHQQQLMSSCRMWMSTRLGIMTAKAVTQWISAHRQHLMLSQNAGVSDQKYTLLMKSSAEEIGALKEAEKNGRAMVRGQKMRTLPTMVRLLGIAGPLASRTTFLRRWRNNMQDEIGEDLKKRMENRWFTHAGKQTCVHLMRIFIGSEGFRMLSKAMQNWAVKWRHQKFSHLGELQKQELVQQRVHQINRLKEDFDGERMAWNDKLVAADSDSFYTRDLLRKITAELEETILQHEAEQDETDVMYQKAMSKHSEEIQSLAAMKDRHCLGEMERRALELDQVKHSHRAEMLNLAEIHSEEADQMNRKILDLQDELAVTQHNAATMENTLKHKLRDELAAQLEKLTEEKMTIQEKLSGEVQRLRDEIARLKVSQAEQVATLDRAHSTLGNSLQMKDATMKAELNAAIQKLKTDQLEESLSMKQENVELKAESTKIKSELDLLKKDEVRRTTEFNKMLANMKEQRSRDKDEDAEALQKERLSMQALFEKQREVDQDMHRLELKKIQQGQEEALKAAREKLIWELRDVHREEREDLEDRINELEDQLDSKDIRQHEQSTLLVLEQKEKMDSAEKRHETEIKNHVAAQAAMQKQVVELQSQLEAAIDEVQSSR